MILQETNISDTKDTKSEYNNVHFTKYYFYRTTSNSLCEQALISVLGGCISKEITEIFTVPLARTK